MQLVIKMIPLWRSSIVSCLRAEKEGAYTKSMAITFLDTPFFSIQLSNSFSQIDIKEQSPTHYLHLFSFPRSIYSLQHPEPLLVYRLPPATSLPVISPETRTALNVESALQNHKVSCKTEVCYFYYSCQEFRLIKNKMLRYGRHRSLK